jgi:SAM-dependent methyltransferase
MPEWWQDFFNQDYIDIYGPEDAGKTEAEVGCLVRLIDLEEGSSILDLCCGYGRHSTELAKKGFRVTGLDFSMPLLTRASQDAKNQNVPLALVRGDMRHIPFGHRFDAVINMFTAFGYFDDEKDDQRVLQGVSSILKTGGKFLLDTVNREYVLSRFTKRSWEQAEDGTYVLDRRSFDLLKSRISAETTLLGTVGKKERRHSMRFYTLTELARMIEKAGMRVRAVFGHLDGREYWVDTRRMVILAEKAGG